MSDALPRTLDTATAERGLNRRQLVKAGVWAAPAVVLATAAPAAAVSVTGVTLSATQQAGANARSWNITLAVAGTASSKSWTVTPIVSGGPAAVTGIPTSISAAGSFTGVVTLTNWGSSATVSFQLTNGSTTIISDAFPVSAPAAVSAISSSTTTQGTGQNRVTILTLAVTSFELPSGQVSVNPASPHTGHWQNGGTNPQSGVVAAVPNAPGQYTITFPAYRKDSNNVGYPFSATVVGWASNPYTGSI